MVLEYDFEVLDRFEALNILLQNLRPSGESRFIIKKSRSLVDECDLLDEYYKSMTYRL